MSCTSDKDFVHNICIQHPIFLTYPRHPHLKPDMKLYMTPNGYEIVSSHPRFNPVGAILFEITLILNVHKSNLNPLTPTLHTTTLFIEFILK